MHNSVYLFWHTAFVMIYLENISHLESQVKGMNDVKVIVDIEWEPNSASTEQNVLQLGAVKINKDSEIIDSYYTVIKPTHKIADIDAVMSIMPISEEQLINGKPKDQVINQFIDWCGEDVTFVVWGSINHKVFKEFMNEKFDVNKSNTIDLQTIYRMLRGESLVCSLSKAFLENNIEIVYPIHHSLNDAVTLAALFKEISKAEIEAMICQYAIEKTERLRLKRLRKRRNQSARNIMRLTKKRKTSVLNKPQYHFFKKEDSDLVHRRNCRCLKDTTAMIKGYSGLVGIMKGYESLCPECFHGHTWFPKDINMLEAIHILELHTICSEYDLSGECYGNTFIIQTNAGCWYFEIGKNNPTLYHRNDIFPWKNKHGVIINYHNQKKEFANDFEIIRYIHKHDKQLIKLLEKKKEAINEL